MDNNLINILMETDPENLVRNTKKDIEIKRLSDLFGSPFVVTVKAIPGDRYSELAGRMIDDDGNPDYTEAYNVNVLVSIDGLVSPDVKSNDLQKHFGCASPKDLLDKLFNGGEIAKIADAITDLSGFGKDTEKKVKNSSTRTEK